MHDVILTVDVRMDSKLDICCMRGLFTSKRLRRHGQLVVSARTRPPQYLADENCGGQMFAISVLRWVRVPGKAQCTHDKLNSCNSANVGTVVANRVMMVKGEGGEEGK